MPPPYPKDACLPAAFTAFACVFGGALWAALTALLSTLFMFGSEEAPWCVLVCAMSALGAKIANWAGAAVMAFVFMSVCPYDLR